MATYPMNTLRTDLTWTPVYATGISEIDKDHQYLFDLIANIISKTQGHKAHRLNYWEPKLSAYAAEHFIREERLMEQYLTDWPQRAGHIQEHRRYWARVANLKWTYSESDFNEFLQKWWTGHVLGWDKAMGVALQQKFTE